MKEHRTFEENINAPQYLTRLLSFLGQRYYLVDSLNSADKWLYMNKLITGEWVGKKIKLEITPEGKQLIYFLEIQFKLKEFIPDFSAKKEYSFGKNHKKAALKMIEFLNC